MYYNETLAKERAAQDLHAQAALSGVAMARPGLGTIGSMDAPTPTLSQALHVELTELLQIASEVRNRQMGLISRAFGPSPVGNDCEKAKEPCGAFQAVNERVQNLRNVLHQLLSLTSELERIV